MSFIYEYLPSGFEGPSNLLRSLPHPPMKAYVRFVNTTNTRLDVMWVDFMGHLKHYRTLGPNEYFDCDTFVDHIWVFKDTRTNDPMCVDHEEIFRPKALFVEENENRVAKRGIVRIHRPVLSLLTLAARVVRNKMRDVVEPFYLEIPFHLQCLISKRILEHWQTLPDRNDVCLLPSHEDPHQIFKKDLDEFQCNVMFIRFKLIMHVNKLMAVSRSSHGDAARVIRQMLQSIMVYIRSDLANNSPVQYSRKLAPTIWKQIIFLRIHLDNLQAGIRRAESNAAYNDLLHSSMRRLCLIPEEQRNSLHRYHWEQLNLLIGDPVVTESERIKSDPGAYDIPKLIPLTQRHDWEWVTVRRKQFLLHQDKDLMLTALRITAHLLRVTDKLENIFQVLCFCHFRLLGHHITDEEFTDELDSKQANRGTSSS